MHPLVLGLKVRPLRDNEFNARLAQLQDDELPEPPTKRPGQDNIARTKQTAREPPSALPPCKRARCERVQTRVLLGLKKVMMNRWAEYSGSPAAESDKGFTAIEAAFSAFWCKYGFDVAIKDAREPCVPRDDMLVPCEAKELVLSLFEESKRSGANPGFQQAFEQLAHMMGCQDNGWLTMAIPVDRRVDTLFCVQDNGEHTFDVVLKD